MDLRKVTLEDLIYLLALLLAVALRFFHLGATPVNDVEAGWALQALDIARGAHPVLGANAAYLLLTGAFFFLFGSTDFLARFWPALFGSLLVLAPWILRERLGRKAALFLAFAIALDPGLVAVSRQAGGGAMAVSAVILALTFWLVARPTWAGIFAGLALLSGPTFWPGLLGIGIAVALRSRRGRSALESANGDPAGADGQGRARSYRRVLIAAAATFLAVGSLFFLVPRGLSAAASSLPAYLSGWAAPSGVSPFRLLASLAVYELMALVFGLWRMVCSLREGDDLDRFLSVWGVIALLVALIYPARQVSDLVWAILPLWALAGRQIVGYLNYRPEELLATLGQMVFVLGASVYLGMNLAAIANQIGGEINAQMRWFAVGGVLLLLALASLLVVWGWSSRVAGRGLQWGGSLALLAYTVFASWAAAGLHGHPGSELWYPAPFTAQSGLLTQTLSDLSDWNTGNHHALAVTVAGVSSPALKWDLRDFDHVTYVDQIPAGVDAPVVIAPQQEQQPALAASYQGEGFVWYRSPNWSLAISSDWLPWIMFRKIQEQDTSLILWARTDLFPGGNASSQSQNP